MMRMQMSRAASGLLRALIACGGGGADRILLTEIESVDWQSLTFTGERHVIRLRVPGPNAEDVLRALTEGLGEAEFAVAGHVVADIALAGQPGRAADGSYTVAIEALTIAD